MPQFQGPPGQPQSGNYSDPSFYAQSTQQRQPIPQQPPPKKKPGQIYMAIGYGVVILFVLSLCLWGVSAVAHVINSTTAVATPTVAPTQAAALDATSVPTDVPTIGVPTDTPTTPPTQPSSQTHTPQPTGPAIVGADISAFIARYGTPNSDSNPSGGGYNFSLYGNPQHDDLSITTEGSKALAILEDAPTDQRWNMSQTISACFVFTPKDTVYKRQMTLLDPQGSPMAVQRVYFSPSLARQFPTSDFTDENGNQTTPGTFGIVLTYFSGSTSSFLSCSAQVGLQGK